jgi:mRNA interferase MazF
VSAVLKRGSVWLADLNPTQGSEQAGTRPVIVFQSDLVSQFSTTAIVIPLTTNQRRAVLPICLPIEQGNGGLNQDSVALCFQMRVLDKTRFIRKLGQLSLDTISQLEEVVLRATRKSLGGAGRTPKSLSLPVFRQMSASECSTSNGRAVSAEEVKCRSTFGAKSRVQARARLLRIMQMNP